MEENKAGKFLICGHNIELVESGCEEDYLIPFIIKIDDHEIRACSTTEGIEKLISLLVDVSGLGI